MNLSNIFIGGVNWSLCCEGANRYFTGNDMGLLSYNNDGRRISIGIDGDHQLTGARLCTGVLITKSNKGWVKFSWNQCTEVKS